MNVVVIVIDTLRADHLSCYGYERETSPEIDRFAETAVLFEQAICPAPWTMSSTSSLLSSLYPLTHGLYHASANRPLPESIVTLPEALGDDWVTGGFVANDLLAPETRINQGFDTYELVTTPHRPDPHADAADKVNGRALPWIRDNRDERFFLYLHYMDPHDPYTDPAEHHREFDPDYTGSFNGHIGHYFKTMAQERRRRPWPIEERDLENMIARYDGEIRYVDAYVREVLDELATLGLDDRTIVVITADHGEQFLEHGGLKHGTSIYQEEVRVPLLVHVPGVTTKPRRVPTPVATLDLYPTLLDLVDIEAPPELDGKSLADAIRAAGSALPAREVRTETSHGWNWAADGSLVRNKSWIGAVIRDNQKMIATVDDEVSAPDELYDLASDPGETKNLASDDAERTTELRGAVESYKARSEERHVHGTQFSPEDRERMAERLRKLGYIDDSPKKNKDDEKKQDDADKTDEKSDASGNGSQGDSK